MIIRQYHNILIIPLQEIYISLKLKDFKKQSLELT